MSIRELVARAEIISNLMTSWLWFANLILMSIVCALTVVFCLQRHETWLAILVLLCGMVIVRGLGRVKRGLDILRKKL